MGIRIKKMICTGVISVLLSGGLVVHVKDVKTIREVTQYYEQEIKGLTSELSELESSNSSLSKELVSSTEKGNILEEEKKSLTKENAALKKSITTLEKQVEELEYLRQSILRTVGYEISKHEYDLLCRLVMSEVGGEGATAQRLVAQVVINRVKSPHFNNTIHTVIYEKNQFEVVNNKSIYRVQPTEQVKGIVKDVLLGKYGSNNYLYFFSIDLRKDHPMWKAVSHDYRTGNMIFSTKWN